MLKEFTSKFRYMGRNFIVHKYTLHFETVRLDFYYTKKALSIKSQLLSLFSLTSSSTLNGPIIVWSIIPAYIIKLLPPHCLLLVTSISDLEKIHPFTHPSCLSNVTLDSSENYSGKVNFHVFLGSNLAFFNIYYSERKLRWRFYLLMPIHKVFYTFCPSSLPQFQIS